MLVKTSITDDIPATLSQMRMYIQQQIDLDGCAYNVNGAFKITGEIDIDRLEKTIKQLVRRHEALRTYFITKNGKVYQRIEAPENMKLVVARSHVEKHTELNIAIQEFIQPFILSELPLFRIAIIDFNGSII